jgi:hypothetical protein
MSRRDALVRTLGVSCGLTPDRTHVDPDGGATIPALSVGMGLHNRRCEYVWCGAVLDIPSDKKPIVMIAPASGAPTMRVSCLRPKR